ncbi:CPBP family intramembrane glutamic endopeptidase, BDIM_20840 family [Sphingopyxis solisilvae]|uniref:CPBP family intramembrane glutamic endopeptidase, BDIM_20840 family n=1 Tax=Sphingopyxis solisilvae TaxID=1886788 RepID=UPI001892B7D4|nr:CPBP family intramembrane glutamic endopeptidase [Sphingopyxis solisilvae]
MNGLIAIIAIVAILLVAGTALGLIRRDRFSLRWLLVAAALVFVNDLLLTRGYGLIPRVLADSDWNWEGKALALLATLAIAALPAFGWRRVGLTLRQEPGSLKAAIPVALLYCAFFAALALAFPGDAPDAEAVAFQLTMPGFEEEPFYRGILLFALAQAFAGRVRFLGVDWHWGAILSCVMFGLAHAFGYSDGSFSFDPVIMALTAIPSLLAIWLVLRTRSLLLPVLLHNFGNAIGYLL